jgi:Domain of unknown function (DUF4333)
VTQQMHQPPVNGYQGPAGPYAPPPVYGPPPGGFGGPPPPPFAAPQPPEPRRRTGLVVGSIVGALVLVAGLAVGALFLFGTTTIDTAEAERQITQLTADQVGVAAGDVTCPEDVEAQAGGTFTCTATLDGQETSFTVEQTDGEGNVQISSDDTYTVVADVEAFLAQEVGEQAGVEAVATCQAEGRTVLVGAPGAPLTCTVRNAADATDSAEVLATVDDTGTVSYEFA